MAGRPKGPCFGLPKERKCDACKSKKRGCLLKLAKPVVSITPPARSKVNRSEWSWVPPDDRRASWVDRRAPPGTLETDHDSHDECDFAAKSVQSGCENVSHNYTGVCPTSVSLRWTWIQILTSLAARMGPSPGTVLVRSVRVRFLTSS
jgi:hypothetical protein